MVRRCISLKKLYSFFEDLFLSTVNERPALLDLLAPRGKLIMVGLPTKQPTINHFNLVLK